MILIWGQIKVESIPLEFDSLINARPTPLLLMAGPGWPTQLPRGFSKATDLTATVNAISNALGQ